MEFDQAMIQYQVQQLMRQRVSGFYELEEYESPNMMANLFNQPTELTRCNPEEANSVDQTSIISEVIASANSELIMNSTIDVNDDIHANASANAMRRMSSEKQETVVKWLENGQRFLDDSMCSTDPSVFESVGENRDAPDAGELMDKLAEYEHAIKKLTTENETVGKQLTQLEEQNHELMRDKKNIELIMISQRESFQKKNASLMEQIEEMSGNMNDIESVKEQMELMLELAEREKRVLDNELEDTRDKLSQSEKQLSKTLKSLQLIKTCNLEKKLFTIEEFWKLDELMHQLEKDNCMCESHNEEIVRLRAIIEDCKSEIADKEKELMSLRNALKNECICFSIVSDVGTEEEEDGTRTDETRSNNSSSEDERMKVIKTRRRTKNNLNYIKNRNNRNNANAISINNLQLPSHEFKKQDEDVFDLSQDESVGSDCDVSPSFVSSLSSLPREKNHQRQSPRFSNGSTFNSNNGDFSSLPTYLSHCDDHSSLIKKRSMSKSNSSLHTSKGSGKQTKLKVQKVTSLFEELQTEFPQFVHAIPDWNNRIDADVHDNESRHQVPNTTGTSLSRSSSLASLASGSSSSKASYLFDFLNSISESDLSESERKFIDKVKRILVRVLDHLIKDTITLDSVLKQDLEQENEVSSSQPQLDEAMAIQSDSRIHVIESENAIIRAHNDTAFNAHINHNNNNNHNQLKYETHNIGDNKEYVNNNDNTLTKQKKNKFNYKLNNESNDGIFVRKAEFIANEVVSSFNNSINPFRIFLAILFLIMTASIVVTTLLPTNLPAYTTWDEILYRIFLPYISKENVARTQ